MESFDPWTRLAVQEAYRVETAQKNCWNVLKNVLGEAEFSQFATQASQAADEALGSLPVQPHAADRILRASFLIKHTQESFPQPEVAEAVTPPSEGLPLVMQPGSRSPAY